MKEKENVLKVKTKKKFIGSEAFWCYVMLALPVIGFVVLKVYPLLWTFRWSFYNYNGIPSQTRFVGLRNFKTIFTVDFTYWKLWGNTLLFALIKLPIELVLAMGLAVLLDKRLKGSGFFQAIYFLPNVISTAIIGLIMSNMFKHNGIINNLLMNVGLIEGPVSWFASKGTAIATVVVATTWAHFGTNVLYVLAALSNVPNELYESASIDGASSFRQFFSITLPMIAPVFQTILLLAILNALSLNEMIMVLTNGGPYGQTNTVMSYIYTKFVPAFADSTTPDIGYGCAMSFLTTVIYAAIALGYNKISKKMKQAY